MKVHVDFDTSKISWFQTGGKVELFAVISNLEELQDFLKSYHSKIFFNNKYHILTVGAGSNILIRQDYLKGAIIKLGRDFSKISILPTNGKNKKIENNYALIEVGASCLSKQISQFAINNNLLNAEFLSTIPGTCGGNIKMNAGCFNNEIKDIFYSVKIFNNGKLEVWDKKQTIFKYRCSNIPDNAIILSAIFKLKIGNEIEINNAKQKLLKMQQHRNETQIIGKTCGSTFANFVDEQGKIINAWKLIDEVGLRGYCISDACFSQKHCNFIINKGNATAKDIVSLIELAQMKVKEKFNINLKTEIKII